MQKSQINLSSPDTAPMPCSKCGGLMRLVGSEPHPTKAGVDLLTFSCVRCETFEAVPVEIPLAN